MDNTTVKPESEFRIYLSAAAAMTVAAFAAFYVTAPGGFLSDDFGLLDLVSRSSFVQLAHDHDLNKFIRPLSLFFLKVNFLLFGLKPAGFWTLSVLNHAANGFLIFLIVRRLSGGIRTAMAAGLIFLMVPLQGEAVAFLGCEFDRLCLFFVLAGVYSYLVYSDGGKAIFYVLSLTSFAFALLSKEMAMTFPALVALIEAFSWRRGWKGFKGTLLRVVPFLAVLGAYLLFRLSLFHGIGGYLDQEGHSRNIVDLSTMFSVLAGLPGFILFPANRDIIRNMVIVYAFFGTLYVTIVATQAVLGRTEKRLLLFGIAWITLTLPPVIGLLPLFPNLNRGRFLYMPLAGFAIFMAGFFGPVKRPGRLAGGIKTALLVALLSGYMVLDAMNYSIWAKAYDIARSIPRQVVQNFSSLPAAARVYFISVPDNYAGAFVYRNGLDSAVNMAYGYQGERRVHVDICDVDGTLLDDPSKSYEDMIAGGGNVYVFWYYRDKDALVRIFPR